MSAKFFRTAPYADDAMNLPVRDVEQAIPFYESKMGFRVVSRSEDDCRRVTLGRDTIQIGLAENGGDPSQEGCFFEVDDVEAALAELQRYGLELKPDIQHQTHGGTDYRLFFVVAPDGLCYCIGQADK
ncbi:VOC family protein [Stratiformator vulcanicus]|uniref:Glyoxalase-like domain protein n=1 Tax=Stratiformator vulcanicus TaxID=2527980 RepID=A0A517R3B5_9PLAN|nr:VOC family protein [Stratiformator vulcanicus]QDT38372.1 Glyoxalase-like domain protein [Stratiformator vulcanicus]